MVIVQCQRASTSTVVYGGFRFGPDMSTSGLLPFKMTSEETTEEQGA
jgi:hypothetical protein